MVQMQTGTAFDTCDQRSVSAPCGFYTIALEILLARQKMQPPSDILFQLRTSDLTIKVAGRWVRHFLEIPP